MNVGAGCAGGATHRLAGILQSPKLGEAGIVWRSRTANDIVGLGVYQISTFRENVQHRRDILAARVERVRAARPAHHVDLIRIQIALGLRDCDWSRMTKLQQDFLCRNFAALIIFDLRLCFKRRGEKSNGQYY